MHGVALARTEAHRHAAHQAASSCVPRMMMNRAAIPASQYTHTHKKSSLRANQGCHTLAAAETL